MVKWISRRSTEPLFWVRVPADAPEKIFTLVQKSRRFATFVAFTLKIFFSRDQTKSVKLLPRLLSMFNSYSATRFEVYLDLVFFLLTALLPRQHLWCAVRRGACFFSIAGQRHKLRFGIVLANYCFVARLLLSHKIKDFAGYPIKAFAATFAI